MNIEDTLTVLGAQKTIIKNDSTGETNDYSKLYYLSDADSDREQVGQCPTSLTINANMFEKLRNVKFPADLLVKMQTVSAAGGKTQLKVIDIKKASVTA